MTTTAPNDKRGGYTGGMPASEMNPPARMPSAATGETSTNLDQLVGAVYAWARPDGICAEFNSPTQRLQRIHQLLIEAGVETRVRGKS